MRRKSDATRRRIIDAAYEQVWRTGFNRTSLDTIAERAGITKRTLYSYFRSKDDLLEAVLSHYNDLAAQRLRIGDGEKRRMRDGGRLDAEVAETGEKIIWTGGHGDPVRKERSPRLIGIAMHRNLRASPPKRICRQRRRSLRSHLFQPQLWQAGIYRRSVAIRPRPDAGCRARHCAARLEHCTHPYAGAENGPVFLLQSSGSSAI